MKYRRTPVHLFGIRGIEKMTDNKTEILKLIFENDYPEKAVMIFADIIDFLKQNEASEEQVYAYLQANFQMSPKIP